jgi:hypothetical protein
MLRSENAELRDRLAGRAPRAATVPPPAPRPPADPEASRAFCRQFLGFIFDRIAEERGKHWELSEAESTQVAVPLAEALGPYLPNLGKAMPFVFAGMALSHVVGVRLKQDRQLKQGGPRLVEQPRTEPSAGGDT